MKYLLSRKCRFYYLAILSVLSLVWPFLSVPDLGVKEFFLYVVGFLTPAIPLFFNRKRIVSLLHRFSKIIFCKWLRGVTISFVAAWVLHRLIFVIGSIIHGNIWLLFQIYSSLLPVLGAYLFSIKKRLVLALMMVAVLLSNWNPLSGILLSLCISIAVIPNRYPLTLQELLTSVEASEDDESDCLYFFVHTAQKRKIIPALENYVSRVERKFLGYHYLLHFSHQLESEAVFRHRVSTAEETLHLSEIEILFPIPRFRDPNEEK